jgi:hypothetical protein
VRGEDSADFRRVFLSDAFSCPDRGAVRFLEAVLISTPEYAHGLPGSLRNALDWIVPSGELYEKPIALINPSPRSTFAQAALTEVLNTMSARIIQEACLTLPMSSPLAPPGILAGSQLSSMLRSSVETLLRSDEPGLELGATFSAIPGRIRGWCGRQSPGSSD